MSHYWDETSLPTQEPLQPVRLPGQPPVPWEWAYLQAILFPGDYADAEIYRPYGDPDDHSAGLNLHATGILVRVYDCLITSGSLPWGTLVQINFHQPSRRWYVTNWRCTQYGP